MWTGRRGDVALISVLGDPAVEIRREAVGAQTVYVRQMGEALGRQGWRVDMFTRLTAPDQARIVEHGPGCRTIRLEAGPPCPLDGDALYHCLPDFISAFLDFQVRSKVQYALVHTNYWLSSWVGMELQKHQLFKHVHTYHSLGLVTPCGQPLQPAVARKRREIEQTSLETSDRLIATSPQERTYLQGLVHRSGDIDIIPCGTDLDTFCPRDRPTARAQLTLDPDGQLLLYAGRFDPRKGLEYLLRALAEPALAGHPHCQLLIAGGSQPGQADGKERRRIEAIAAALGLSDRLRFLGRLDQAILATYYAAADLCAIPSQYEPFGLVALEAMACGTPVVASAVGGLTFSVLPGSTGLLVPPRDPAALAAALARLLDQPDLRQRMGQAAQARVRTQFGWNEVAKRVSDIYASLLRELHSEFFTSDRAS